MNPADPPPAHPVSSKPDDVIHLDLPKNKTLGAVTAAIAGGMIAGPLGALAGGILGMLTAPAIHRFGPAMKAKTKAKAKKSRGVSHRHAAHKSPAHRTRGAKPHPKASSDTKAARSKSVASHADPHSHAKDKPRTATRAKALAAH